MQNGKGDEPRNVSPKFGANLEKIFGKKDIPTTPAKFKKVFKSKLEYIQKVKY